MITRIGYARRGNPARRGWQTGPVLAFALSGLGISCEAELGVETEAAPAALVESAAEEAGSVYREGPRTADGIGKYYLGREIADYIRGHGAIVWLERRSREREEEPDKLVEALDLAPGAVVADIGAGSGYISFRIAERTPEGRVYAVDIQEEMLEFLEKRIEETGLSQVVPVLGTIEDTKLPEGEVDAAILVDAYHEFSHPYEIMTSVVRALKKGGRVYLVEYRANDPDVPIKPLHTMTPEQAKKEMEAVGLRWKETLTILPWQYVFVFEKP
ncbi:MAG TPA: class I SAM-dependent methyltransferase [Verrucomicrobiales bacterium]|nr:class I SAM-dependent methyltransferase [Verrucomicrobiales bacterium]